MVVKKKRGRPKGSRNTVVVKDRNATDVASKIRMMPSDTIAVLMAFYIEGIIRTVSAMSPELMRDVICYCIATLVKNRKKVVGDKSLTRDASIVMLYRLLWKPEEVADTILSMKLEHVLILKIAAKTLTEGHGTVAQRRNLAVLLDDVVAIRGMIVSRYSPLIRKRSSAHVWGRKTTGINLDLDDTTQNFSAAVLKALDRYDSGAGSLTSYVGVWMRDAASSNMSPVGESFSITRSGRAAIVDGRAAVNNKSVSLEDAHHVADEAISFESPSEIDLGFLDTVIKTGRASDFAHALVVIHPALEAMIHA